MGGGTSKFEVTDWQKADGLLQETKDTIDGSPPTKKYQVVHLIKKGINQREFDVIDDEQNLLYTTRAVPGTLAWFDVLGPKSCADYADFLLRVQVDLARRTWIVYRYHRPVFEGQLPATLNPRKSLVPSVCLYKTACITVAWSRYVAISARYGPPSLDYLLQLEKMEEDENGAPNDGSAKSDPSMTNAGRSKSDSSLVDNATNVNQEQTVHDDDDDDDDEDLVSAARKVAARRRADTASDVQTDGTTATDAETPEPESTDRDAATAKEAEPEKSSEDVPADTLASQSMEETNEKTTDGNTTPDSIPQKAFSFDTKWPLRFKRNTSDKESSKPTATDNNDTDDAITDDENLSNNTSGNSLARTSERLKQYWANRKLFGNDDSADAATPQSRKEAAHQAAMEGVIDLDGPLVECQEIYNKFFGNHQTSYIAKDQVLKLLPLDEARHRQEIDAKGADDSENPFFQAVHQQEHEENPEEQTDSQSHHNWLSRLQQKMSTVGANNNNNSNSNDANEENAEAGASAATSTEKPMGWKYFDRTLRAKSNATSTTTSEETTGTTNKTSPRKWFKFGARQGSDEHKPDEEQGGVEVELSSKNETGELQVSSVVVEDSPDKQAADTTTDEAAAPTKDNEKEEVTTDKSSPLENDEENEPTEPSAEVPPIVEEEKDANSEDANVTAKNDATEEDEPKLDAVSTEPTGDKVDSNPTEMLSTEAAEETLGAEPLICYWAWRNSYMVQKVELHLAQNSDLALHVVLAILCNQVRYERNALAMTV